MRFDFFSRVRDSTCFAKARCLLLGNVFARFSRISQRVSGLNFDFTLCPIPGIFSHFCFIVFTKFSGEVLFSTDSSQYFPAPSIAPPNLGPTVASPAMREDLRSFPALEVIIAFVAPDTAGPWSAIRTITVLIKLQAYSGSSRLSQRWPMSRQISGFCVNSETLFPL